MLGPELVGCLVFSGIIGDLFGMSADISERVANPFPGDQHLEAQTAVVVCCDMCRALLHVPPPTLPVFKSGTGRSGLALWPCGF